LPRSSSRNAPRPRRPVSLRARRRRARALIASVAIALAAAAAYGISYASYLPLFTIGAISVSGSEAISPKLIERYAESVVYDGSYGFLSRADIFLYPRADIEQGLSRFFPRIESARVARASMLASTVAIAIVERKQFAQWCADEQCYSMDEKGFIFARAASTTTQYVFRGGLATSSQPVGQRFASAQLPGILVALKLFGQAGFHPLGAFVKDDKDFTMPLVEGYQIKASFGADAMALVRNLELVLSSDVLKGKENSLEYVDLRFGNRVYYKLKGQEQQSVH
jgi:cell division septal protein FtsQ